jgi:fructose-1,6-bisphosphatase/inositol monophosphatase family enzyme
LLAIAIRAADAAAAVVRASIDPERYTGAINSGGDRVLAVDVAADQAAQRVLAESCGDAGQPYALFSEESGHRRFGADSPLFVIDPVDGSAQARRFHPDCAVSIAVATGETMAEVVAAVVQPIGGGEPYTALRGAGAHRGDRPLPLLPLPDGPAASMLVEGPDATATVRMAGRFAVHDPSCQIHISGSIALQLALLAAGSYDLLIGGRPGACAYDIAAGWLIGLEAGTVFADLQGLNIERTPLADISVQHQLVAARRVDLLSMALRVAQSPAMAPGAASQHAEPVDRRE